MSRMEELNLPKLLKFEFRAPKEAVLIQQQARFVLDIVDYIGQLGKLSPEVCVCVCDLVFDLLIACISGF